MAFTAYCLSCSGISFPLIQKTSIAFIAQNRVHLSRAASVGGGALLGFLVAPGRALEGDDLGVMDQA
ncbi:hypothetical protein, partial [Thauera phenylacetica]|uniref:hypothetical protein n=1 Tax=Thauera phenylacetica TaxID=164400 RepID=UPI001B7FCFFF